MRFIKIGVLKVVLLMIPIFAMAQMNSASYGIPTHTEDEGGLVSSSTSYQLHTALGQSSPIGVSTSSNYRGHWGYIYMIPRVTAHPCVCGDINCDGSVTYADLTYLGGYLFAGGPPPVDPWAADLNGCDGSITYSDLTYLGSYLFSGGAAPQCCPKKEPTQIQKKPGEAGKG